MRAESSNSSRTRHGLEARPGAEIGGELATCDLQACQQLALLMGPPARVGIEANYVFGAVPVGGVALPGSGRWRGGTGLDCTRDVVVCP